MAYAIVLRAHTSDGMKYLFLAKSFYILRRLSLCQEHGSLACPQAESPQKREAASP